MLYVIPYVTIETNATAESIDHMLFILSVFTSADTLLIYNVDI